MPAETKQIRQQLSPLLGCDPEIFIQRNGEIVGAERVIPEAGLDTPTATNGYALSDKSTKKGIVLDGVQAELNPRPSHCRAIICSEISAAFVKLREHLAKQSGMEVCFKQVVEVDPKELDTLSDKAKVLGCQPSRNIYDTKATIGVNPSTYTKRSAGGHIHLGINAWKPLMDNRERLVMLLDILVGNTSVLIDRDPGNAERRQVYGRAGEHRMPKHGLEYRTLSNFWLRSYPLASMVFAMSRMAVNILASQLYAASDSTVISSDYCWGNAETTLLEMVDVEAVQRAINDNDLKLAKRNWEAVSRYLLKHTTTYISGITASNLVDFNFFIQKLDEKGLEYWFPDDPIVAWTDKFGVPNAGAGGYADRTPAARQLKDPTVGWEGFLQKVKLERTGYGLYKAA